MKDHTSIVIIPETRLLEIEEVIKTLVDKVEPKNDFITDVQLAERLNKKLNTIRGWIRDGKLTPSNRLGDCYIFFYSDLKNQRLKPLAEK